MGRLITIDHPSKIFTQNLQKPHAHPKIVVGLTTIPSRINTLEPTLTSLLQQTLKPDEIVLSIPKLSARFNTGYVISDPFLQDAIDNGSIIFNQLDDDYGPATKFVGLIKRGYQPFDTFIWVDDDIIYSKNVVENLAICLLPNTAVGLSGFNFAQNGSYVKVSAHFKPADILEGFSGVVAYSKNMPSLHELEAHGIRAQTHEQLQRADVITQTQFLSDDFMISHCLQKRGTQTLVCYQNECNYQNCIQVREMGYLSDALHLQTHQGHFSSIKGDTNIQNYNLLRQAISQA